MLKIIGGFLFWSALIYFAFLLGSKAEAAPFDPVGADTQEQMHQQERQRLLRQQQEIKPDARNAEEQLKTNIPVVSDVIPENEAPCFVISKIEMTGDSAGKFQFALDSVIQNIHEGKPILGRCLGAVGINAIMVRVQNAIIAKGYVTTRVLVAPQDLKTGVLQLTIIPGRESMGSDSIDFSLTDR